MPNKAAPTLRGSNRGIGPDDQRRAIRLVVDTGLHAMDRSEQQAVDYMLANSPIPELNMRAEIQRYIVNPGQAPQTPAPAQSTDSE